MALHNISTENTPEQVSVGITFSRKTIHKMVLAFVAVAVLAAAYVVGSTIKERVTDPAIDEAGAALSKATEKNQEKEVVSQERQDLERAVLAMYAAYYPNYEVEIVSPSEARRLAKKYGVEDRLEFLEGMSPEETQKFVFLELSEPESGISGLAIHYLDDGVVATRY